MIKSRLLAVMLCLALLPALAAVAQEPGAVAGQDLAASAACRPTLVERQRYGFVATSGGWPVTFDVARLRAGTAADLTLGAPPAGMDRALVLRTAYGYRVNPDVLGPLVDANPGATWLVGNEPDSIWQDDLPPAEYARIYHDVYVFLKRRDASSRIAPGGVVQPTPLRLQYLDLVLQAYRARYGRALPADLWHTHNAILNEVSCSYDPNNCWGAQIPSGIDADYGVIRSVDDNDNVDIFKAQIWAFRQWMAGRGYGGLPLIVSEFGILMPASYGFDVARVNAFMTATFDFMATVADPVLGDPLDGGRLVQRWTWFSLDVPPFEVDPSGFNGNLFNPDTTAITDFGLHYEGLTVGFPALDYAELGLVRWLVPAVGRPLSPSETVTLPVTVRVGNSGTSPAAAFQVRLAYSGPRHGTLEQTVLGLPAHGSAELTFSLAGLVPGVYDLDLTIDALGQVAEPAECDNHHLRSLIVPTHVLHLPVVMQRAGLLLGQLAAAPDLAPVAALEEAAGPASTPTSTTVQGVEGLALPALREFPLPQPGSAPGQLVIDPATGGVWVTERDGNRLALFDPATEVWIEYPIPTANSRPWGLALDGAGNVWFAESAANQIGKLAMATGQITEYGGLQAGSEPFGVAVADSDVWFTERAGNAMGGLDPVSGAVNEYPIAVANSRPSGLSAYWISTSSGPLWYLWFAEPGSNLLGRMRLADKTLYHLAPLTPNSGLQDVVWEGGVPWITELAANQIATFGFGTTSLWTEVPLPVPDSEPYGITLQGADLVWFTERAGNRVGRYRVSTRALVEYSLPVPASQPTDIAIDAAGCAWYAASGSNRIGRLCPSALRPVYLPTVVR